MIRRHSLHSTPEVPSKLYCSTAKFQLNCNTICIARRSADSSDFSPISYQDRIKDSQMLEAIQTSRLPIRVSQTMPVDFATYLLSSSPPASNFEFLSCFNSESTNWTQGRNGFVNSSNFQSRSSIIKHANSNLQDEESCSDESVPNSGQQTPTRSASPGRANKKVSFADHKGFALTTVRIMTEPSDMPPRLGPEVLSSITKGAKASVTGSPPFELKFSQPASDYLAFREKIERNLVSLENVILRDYNVMGTIKVKNICFEKNVFVRCTYDSWNTTTDLTCSYVSPPGDSSGQTVDTFSFEMDIDTNFNPDKNIEFAVCFATPTGQHWDNNGGQNYQIYPTNYSQPQKSFVQSNNSSEFGRSFTEYACWNHVDMSAPYY